MSTLSGRTAAYRTTIVQSQAFYTAFLEDMCLRRLVTVGDDKALTRWTFMGGWQIRIVCSERCVLYTTVDEGSAFIYQCFRWARAHWQGNFAVVTRPRDCDYLWKKHPWALYAIYFGSLMTPAALVDGGLFYLLRKGLMLADVSSETRFGWLVAFWIFTLLQKTVKMWPHFMRYPQDLWAVPALIAFSYLHGFINIAALLSMTSSSWGNKKT